MSDLLNWPPTWNTLLLVPALLVGFTVHELAHAIVAFMLGDTSQVERKRLTFNPLRHVSWLGMAAFLLIGFGWAKPVWVDYTRFRIRNRAFGMFLVSISGASANLATGLLVLMAMMITVSLVSGLTGEPVWNVLMLLIGEQAGLDAQGLAIAFSTYMVSVNLILALFNMLPLPPLDGFQALISLYTVIRNALKSQTGNLLPLPATRPATRAPEGEAAPSPAQIHFDIGLAYHKEGQIDEAIARYRQAIAHDEQLALAYYNEGLAYWAKGRLPLASSAFRAAMQTGGDVNVRAQANLRLQELARAEQDPEPEPTPVPPPLEPGSAPEVAAHAPPPLDPEVERRVWLRLGVGGVVMFSLAISVWLYVTVVVLASVG